MSTILKLRIGIRKANNQPVAVRGLVTTTAPGPDLCHTLPVGRTVILRRIWWSNRTGVNSILQFGTLTNAAVWFPLTPAIDVLTGFDDFYPPQDGGELDVEFANDRTAGAGGVTGNIHVQAGVAGVGLAGILVRLIVEEIGR